MCLVECKGTANEGDIIAVEKSFLDVGGDVRRSGKLGVTRYIDTMEGNLTIARISECRAVDSEAMGHHDGCLHRFSGARRDDSSSNVVSQQDHEAICV